MNNRDYMPFVIAICGKKRSGKDTIANYISDKYGYNNVKFADPLKNMLKAGFNFTDEQLESKKEEIDDYWRITPRQAMQFIGTEIMQYELQKLVPNLDRHFFVASLFKRYPDEHLVISDLRFVHEEQAIKQIKNNLIIKVIRDSNLDTDNHISENELDQIDCDCTIRNNKDLDELYKKVDNIIESFRIKNRLNNIFC